MKGRKIFAYPKNDLPCKNKKKSLEKQNPDPKFRCSILGAQIKLATLYE